MDNFRTFFDYVRNELSDEIDENKLETLLKDLWDSHSKEDMMGYADVFIKGYKFSNQLKSCYIAEISEKIRVSDNPEEDIFTPFRLGILFEESRDKTKERILEGLTRENRGDFTIYTMKAEKRGGVFYVDGIDAGITRSCLKNNLIIDCVQVHDICHPLK